MGIHLSYKIQNAPNGKAEALILGKEFVGQDDVCLILGDNIFYMGDQIASFTETINNNTGAVICTYHVPDPQRFGVAQITEDGMVLSLEEKPKFPKSNLAVTGLYFYKNDAIDRVQKLKPSARGELEITDLNLEYLNEGRLKVFRMIRGTSWLDVVTPDSLLDAALFVQMIEKRQGLKISCIEEIALNKDFISVQQFENLIASYKGPGKYKLYLERVLYERKANV